jgi:hypothetical protein
MTTFRNIAYARLNFEFDHKKFAEEYDQIILNHPQSYMAANSLDSMTNTQQVNRTWGMVDPEVYPTCDVTVGYQNIEKRQHRQWQMCQMMMAKSQENLGSDFLEQESQRGGAYARNNLLDEFWIIKPEFKNLTITQWILQNLPFKRIVAIHCVSLEPGNFASIHRDLRHWDKDKANPGLNNGLYQKGFVVINLNISSGGVPLYWTLDGHSVFEPPIKTDDSCYMTSDYFLHGVPQVKTRRRQIRVTGIPKESLAEFIDQHTVIKLPEDYVFDSENNLYPG